LFSYNLDTSIIRSVQLEHHLPHIFRAIDSPRECQNSGSLSGARRAVEEEVGEAVGVNKAVYGCEDVLVAGDVFEGVGAIFLDPA